MNASPGPSAILLTHFLLSFFPQHTPVVRLFGPNLSPKRNYVQASEMEKIKAVRKRLMKLREKKLEELRERKQKPLEIVLPVNASAKSLSAVMGINTIDILKVAIKCGVRFHAFN